MSFSRLALLLTLLHPTYAKQPEAPEALSSPLRELPWAQLNFLHTTDTHGWHAGHLQEPQYSADWGDYISFASHLHARADAEGTDLLLIDTGDRIEGNGLYDASDPKGKYTFDGIFNQQKIDVITTGNHELYQANSSNREYNEVVPDFKDSYIASNLDIHNPKTGSLEPLAPRYRKFTTKNQGIRILAFGFLFNFHGNANNTYVQPVQETIKEQWFQDAIREKGVDLFLVAGHVPVRDSQEFDAVYKAIREVKWDTPIVFFGGHTHIRDYRKYEKKAYGIESGRYMETIGFLSIDGLNAGGKKSEAEGREVEVEVAKNPSYKRLYLDNNLYSLHHHSGTNSSTFPTELGTNVSSRITAARKALNLDKTFGCAPQDYWLNRAPYPSNSSLLSLLDEQVLPDSFVNETSKPTIVLTNSGAMRFDVFKGAFTIDSTFLVSPFTSGFRVLKDVPYSAASQVLQLLNNEGQIMLQNLLSLARAQEGEESEGVWGEHKLLELLPPFPPVGAQTLRARHEQREEVRAFGNQQQQPLTADDSGDKKKENLIPGYTTTDDAGTDGDDTIHESIKFYDVPNCIGSNINFDKVEVFNDIDGVGLVKEAKSKPETVDLVYNEFIQDWVLLALRYLGKTYEKSDTQVAVGGKEVTEVLSEWVAGHWGCEEGV